MSWKTIQLLQGLGDRIGAAGGQVLSGLRQARLDEERRQRRQEEQDRYDTSLYLQHPEMIPGEGAVAAAGRPKKRLVGVDARTEQLPSPTSLERQQPQNFVGPPSPEGTRTTYSPKFRPTSVGGGGTGISGTQLAQRAAKENDRLTQQNLTAQPRMYAEKRQTALDEYNRAANIADRTLKAAQFAQQTQMAQDEAKRKVESSLRNTLAKLLQARSQALTDDPDLALAIEDTQQRLAEIGAGPGGAQPQSTQTQPAPPEGPKPEEIAAARRDPAGTIDRLVTAGAQGGLPFDQITAALAKLGINLPPEVAQRAQQRYQALRAQQEADTDREARDFEAAVRGYREETVPPQLSAYPGRGRL